MKKNIQFFSLDRQYQKIKTKILEKTNEVLDKQSYVGGPFVQEFETKISKYLNVNHAISCNSGTDALWLALKALDIQKNSIVLTTPFSFIASSSEISAHEAHPVFIDVDPKTYNIDPIKIKKWIKENTVFENSNLIHKETGYPVVGILSVDIFGQCADYTQIKSIADEFNLWIIEDACQAIGAQDSQKRKAGTLGDISCFSFYPTKNLGAFGDAGCCTTNNPMLAEKLMQLRNHGRKSHYNYITHGINSRMDALQAAVLGIKLDFLDEFNNSRREIAKIYNQELSEINLLETPTENNGKHVYHQYCIKTTNRSELISKLKDLGVNTNIYYPKSLNEIEFLNKDKRLKTECPISKSLTENILALPIWPELTKEEVEYICESVVKSNDNKHLLFNKTNGISKCLN